MRKAKEKQIEIDTDLITHTEISAKEKLLLKRIALFPEVVSDAGENYSPAIIANYCYELVKEYNQFYHDHSILNIQDKGHRAFRLILSTTVGKIIKTGMNLLGIDVPSRM